MGIHHFWGNYHGCNLMYCMSVWRDDAWFSREKLESIRSTASGFLACISSRWLGMIRKQNRTLKQEEHHGWGSWSQEKLNLDSRLLYFILQTCLIDPIIFFCLTFIDRVDYTWRCLDSLFFVSDSLAIVLKRGKLTRLAEVTFGIRSYHEFSCYSFWCVYSFHVWEVLLHNVSFSRWRSQRIHITVSPLVRRSSTPGRWFHSLSTSWCMPIPHHPSAVKRYPWFSWKCFGKYTSAIADEPVRFDMQRVRRKALRIFLLINLSPSPLVTVWESSFTALHSALTYWEGPSSTRQILQARMVGPLQYPFTAKLFLSAKSKSSWMR